MSQFPRSILFPAIACLLFLLSACATTPETGARVTPLPVTPQAVSIFYATNRASDPEPGEYFGPERGSVFSVNFRYYLVYLLSGALPSTYNLYTGEIAGTKKEFGGIAITISFGSSF